LTDDPNRRTEPSGPHLHQEAQTSFLTCDGRTFKRLIRAGLAWLERHQAVINALNVYPVPDGDTGTNMLLTMQAAWAEIQDSPEDNVGAIAQKVAKGALMGARGNSGVILSQIFRGLARSLDSTEVFDAVQFASALREAAATAYKGVVKPVEGTILTVAREAAEAAVMAATSSPDLRYVLERVTIEAGHSVTRTPNLLPVLAEAGVVDAGGQGLFVILEGMLRSVRGDPVTFNSALTAQVHLRSLQPESEEGYGYDVQFIIHGEDLDVEQIRQTIAAMGESALVVGDSTAIKVHVHLPNPGDAIGYGAGQGSLSHVIVENMQEQYQEYILSRAQRPTLAADALAKISTVVVSFGTGLIKVFESLGANAVVPGGQTMNPSTEDILKAVEGTPSNDVIILPNNKNIVMTAEQAKSLSRKNVQVVRTITIPQGIAALLALNYQADLSTNARVMTDATQTIQTAEITTAIRSAQINGMKVEHGEVIGLVNGELKVKGAIPAEVVLVALKEMNTDLYEIVTLYYGESITPDEADQIAAQVAEQYPGQEVEVVDGGQPHYHYIISVE
jgi:DAK2 domain fusion protein YloV